MQGGESSTSRQVHAPDRGGAVGQLGHLMDAPGQCTKTASSTAAVTISPHRATMRRNRYHLARRGGAALRRIGYSERLLRSALRNISRSSAMWLTGSLKN